MGSAKRLVSRERTYNFGLPLPDIGASAKLATSKFTLKDFVSHLTTRN